MALKTLLPLLIYCKSLILKIFFYLTIFKNLLVLHRIYIKEDMVNKAKTNRFKNLNDLMEIKIQLTQLIYR